MSKIGRRITLVGIISTVVAAIVAVVVTTTVMATGTSSYLAKAYGYGIYNCYVNAKNGSKYTMLDFLNEDAPSVGEIHNYKDVIKSNDATYNVAVPGKGTNGQKISCQNYLAKGDKGSIFTGIKDVDQKVSFMNEAEKDKMFTALGFQKENKGLCIQLHTHTIYSDGIYESYHTSNVVCGPKDGTLSYKTVYYIDGEDDGSPINFMDMGDYLDLDFQTSHYTSAGGTTVEGSLGNHIDYEEVNNARVKGMQGMARKIRDGFTNIVSGKYYEKTATNIKQQDGSTLNGYTVPLWDGRLIYLYDNPDMIVKTHQEVSYKMSDRNSTALSTINRIFGTAYTSLDNLKYSNSERADLYSYYIYKYYEANKLCPDGSSQDEVKVEDAKSKGAVQKNDSNGNVCYVWATKNKDNKVFVPGLSTQLFDGTATMTFADLVNYELTSVDEAPTVDIYTGDPTDPSNPSSIDDGGGSAGPCWNSGLESMAWVACPIESNLTGFAQGVSALIDGWMEVDSDLYGNESEAKIIWGYIRTIANVALIGILAFIIFSQITGYGIDNYGIKKTLPKLIVTIILINLSFIICQLAIDLSNTLGHGIESLFYGLGNSLVDGSDRASGLLSDFVGALVASIYSITAVGAPAITMVAAFSSGGGNVMTVALVLLLLLTVVVAVLLFFISIGARTIIIIMCAALSPLAFVFYALPNTKQIYKKWFDAFKAALIIYPICGAVLGISYVLKAIAVTQELSLPMMIVVGIAPYLPFFMIPAMLKGAINTLGTVGAALSTMGSTFRNGVRNTANGASGLIKDSAAYKAAQEQANWDRQRRFADRVHNRLTAKRERNGGELGKRDARRLYNADMIRNRNANEQAMANAGAVPVGEELAAMRAESSKEAQELKNYSDQYSTLTRGLMDEELGAAVRAYNPNDASSSTRLQAAIMAAEGRGMNKEMLNRLGSLNLSNERAEDAKVLGRLASSHNQVLSQYGKQMAKAGAGSMSLNNFTSKGAQEDGVSLSKAFASKGSGVLNGMDDDTLAYINTTNAGAVSSDMLMSAASSTTNQKELAQINSMINKLSKPSEVKFTAEQLASFDPSTVKEILTNKNLTMDSDFDLMLTQAYVDLSSDPRLLAKMNPTSRSMIENYSNK